MLVMNDAVLWVQQVPIFYLPTYVYGGPVVLASSQFIPDIVNESVQGLTIRQRFGYVIDENNTGYAELAFTQNLGFGLGLTHGLRWQRRSDIEVQLQRFDRSGYQGHFALASKLIPLTAGVTTDDNDLLGDLFNPFVHASSEYLLDWHLLVSSREIANYQRVSLLPEVVLGSRRLLSGLQLLAATAYINEESTGVQTQRSRLEVMAEKSLTLSDVFRIATALDARTSLYDLDRCWNRIIAGADLIAYVKPYTFSLGYATPLINQGSSPLSFDSYQVQDSPEYRLAFSHEKDFVKVFAAYKSQALAWRTASIHLEQPLHEVRITLDYEAVAGSLGFGVRLVEL
jgi:hypothetical protein